MDGIGTENSYIFGESEMDGDWKAHKIDKPKMKRIPSANRNTKNPLTRTFTLLRSRGPGGF
jgi:hypothetical protein